MVVGIDQTGGYDTARRIHNFGLPNSQALANFNGHTAAHTQISIRNFLTCIIHGQQRLGTANENSFMP